MKTNPKDSGQELREILQHSPTAIYRRNYITDKYEYMSPAIKEITGYEPDEMLQMSMKEVTQLIFPDDRISTVEKLENHLASGGGTIQLTYRIIHKNGEIRWVSDTMHTFMDSNGQPLSTVGSLLDVTSRYQSEESLRRSQIEYKTILQTAIDGFYIIDVNAHFLDVNDAFCRMTGYSRKELLNLSIADLEIIENEESLKSHMNKIMQTGFDRFESKQKWKNNKIVDVEVISQYLKSEKKFFVFLRDITESKLTKERLYELNERFKLAAKSGHIGIWDLDCKTNLLTWDSQMYKIYGVQPGIPISFEYWMDLIHKDDIPLISDSIKKCILNKMEDSIEFRLFDPEDNIKYINSSHGVLLNKDDQVIRVVGINKDITDQKKSITEHLRLQNLESLGILAGGIAHDFNNILTSLSGQASLIYTRTKEENTRESISKILEATKRAVGLTHQLLTFAKGGTPQKSEINLQDIIEETTKFSLSGSNINPKFIFNHTYGLEADARQISQVIQNMVINAKQSMPNGGSLEISTDNISFDEDEPGIQIRIKDSGCGIPHNFLEKIFNPYFTTKETGSGLGLSVCHSIIKRHGGGIIVESLPGNGTIFIIKLPALSGILQKDTGEHDEKSKNTRYKNNTGSNSINANELIHSVDEQLTTDIHNITKFIDSSTNGIENKHEKCINGIQPLNLLIMDDEEPIREVLKDILIELGHFVTCASEGIEAFSIYKSSIEQNKPFDIVFLDLTIKGGLGGIDTMKKIRKINPSAKIVVSSGYADQIKSNFRDDGFDWKIDKPYTLDEINIAINRIININ
jgi:PAS domain S-box-containing protein